MGFLYNKYARALTLVLLLQMGLYYAVASRAEQLPEIAPLSTFPHSSQSWQTIQDIPIEPEVRDILKADDILNRVYANPSRAEQAFLFIAFFKTQRSGQAPHSPKNCLPGSGWAPVSSGVISIPVTGRAEPILSNEYVVERANEKDIVLYWYQSHDRIIASEYAAKFWLIADAVRYHHSDTALVKVIVPVQDGDVQRAMHTGVEFIQAVFSDIRRHLPA